MSILLKVKNFFFKFKKQKSDDTKQFLSSNYNILFLVKDLYFSEQSTHIIETANFLSQANIGVVILTNGTNMRNIINGNIVLIVKKKFWGNNIINSMKNKYFVKKICRKYSIDIINTFSIMTSWTAYFVAKSNKNITFMTTICDIIDISTHCKYHVAKILNKSPKVICHSRFIGSFIVDKFKISLNNLFINFNGIDFEYFDRNKVQEERIIETANKIIKDRDVKKILLCPCNFHNINDLSFILEVLEKIKRDDYFCIMIGDFLNTNNERKKLLLKIKQLNLMQKIILVDRFTDMQPVFLLSYAMLYITSKEPAFCRDVMEAYAMFRPVIATKIGCIPDYIVDNKTGFLIRKNGFLELQDAINNILSISNEQYNKMATNGYNYIHQHFDMQKNLKSLNNLLLSMKH